MSHGQLQRGAYRAKPVRRVHTPKADGRLRPIGVPTLEDEVYVGITRKKVNWVLDVDIRVFFAAIAHEWLMRFIEHRSQTNVFIAT